MPVTVIWPTTPTLSVALTSGFGNAEPASSCSGLSPAIVTSGGVVSTTVTVNCAVWTFPAASDAVQVTTVSPSGKVDSAGGTQTSDCTKPELSVAVTSKSTTASPVADADTVIGDGAGVNTGGVTSITSISNDALVVLPAASVAVQVTTVIPIGNAEPEGGSQMIVTLPVALSFAVGA